MLEPEVFVLLGVGAALPYIGDAVYCWARDKIMHNCRARTHGVDALTCR